MTSVVRMPTIGMEQLEMLDLRMNDYLRDAPSFEHFAELKFARMRYNHHCCPVGELRRIMDNNEKYTTAYDMDKAKKIFNE